MTTTAPGRAENSAGGRGTRGRTGTSLPAARQPPARQPPARQAAARQAAARQDAPSQPAAQRKRGRRTAGPSDAHSVSPVARPRTAAAQKMSAAERAYDKRRRRAERMADPRLTRVGHPIRETMARIPFVIVVLAVLAVGGVGVLYLNTRTDEAGMRTTESQDRSNDLRLGIEQLKRDIAGLDATPEIARRAQQLGLVPAGDPAIIRVPVKGPATVIGTPHPATATAAAPRPPSTGGTR